MSRKCCFDIYTWADTGSRDQFTEQWKWAVVIGRRRRRNTLRQVTKKKNLTTILDGKLLQRRAAGGVLEAQHALLCPQLPVVWQQHRLVPSKRIIWRKCLTESRSFRRRSQCFPVHQAEPQISLFTWKEKKCCHFLSERGFFQYPLFHLNLGSHSSAFTSQSIFSVLLPPALDWHGNRGFKLQLFTVRVDH